MRCQVSPGVRLFSASFVTLGTNQSITTAPSITRFLWKSESNWQGKKVEESGVREQENSSGKIKERSSRQHVCLPGNRKPLGPKSPSRWKSEVGGLESFYSKAQIQSHTDLYLSPGVHQYPRPVSKYFSSLPRAFEFSLSLSRLLLCFRGGARCPGWHSAYGVWLDKKPGWLWVKGD